MAERGEPLSDRELEVLNRLAVGESNKAIADGLSISPLTVKTHLRNIYTKLGVSTRTEAMTVALQQGVVTVGAADGSVSRDEFRVPGEEEMAEEGPSITRPPTMDGSPASDDLPVIGVEGAAVVGSPHRWRNLSLALLGLLALLVGIFIFVQRREGALFTPTPEPFAEQTLGDTRWLSSRPLPEARAGRAAAAIGLDVYLIGGETAAGVSDAVAILDTQTRQWRQATPKPTAVSAATAAELFGEIYVPGGATTGGAPTTVVEAYSPAQNAWRRVAPLPQPVAGGLAVVDGGFLFVLGGRDKTGALDTAFIYDPAADNWRPIAPMPAPRADAAGGALLGMIYVVGGRDGEGPQDSCFVYDPAADAWDECPAMLLPRAGAGATVLLNKLYVVGGAAGPEAAHGEVYEPNSRTWTVLDAPPDSGGWTEPGVAHVEARIYALGGHVGDALSDATLIYAPLAYQTFIPAAPSDGEE